MTETKPVHQSRWGYHAVSYETSRKLRRLAKLYWQALHQIAAWRRWYRKAPHNRVAREKFRNDEGQVFAYGNPVPINEPRLNPMMIKVSTIMSRLDINGVWHSEARELKVVRLSQLALIVIADLRRAQKIYKRPEDVIELEMSEEQIGELEAAYRLEIDRIK